MAAEELDTEGLDAEELKALAEVSKKGYYHARPKSEAVPVPHRLAEPAPADVSNSGKRADFDAYQKKWDRFDTEEPELETVDSGGGIATASRMAPNAEPARLRPPSPPPSADEAVVQHLSAMGFSVEESRAAAIATKNRVDAAVEYILGGGAAPSRAAAPRTADPEKLALLVEMGFPEKAAREALVESGNDVDRAVERVASLTANDSTQRLRTARDTLGRLESDVTAYESGVQDGTAAPNRKRVKLFEETLTEVSCSLDRVVVDGDAEARAARRVELDRCNVLDTRIGKLRNASGATGAAAGTITEASTEERFGESEGARAPTLDPAAALEPAASSEASAEFAGDAGASATLSASQERIAEAERLRLAGNEAFKTEDYALASKHYLGALELDGENVAILSNLAAAELKLGAFEAAAVHAAAANEISGGFSTKALFRQAQAFEGLERFADACQAYQAALVIEPNDRLVRQKLQSCRKALDEATQASAAPATPTPPANTA